VRGGVGGGVLEIVSPRFAPRSTPLRGFPRDRPLELFPQD
jgi:hypothetical protein